MAAMKHGNDAVISSTQLVQYDDDDDNDDKIDSSHSDHLALVRETTGEDSRNVAAGSDAHLDGEEGMDGAEADAGIDRGAEVGRDYDYAIHGEVRDDVYLETRLRGEMTVQQTHGGTDGADLAAEAMRVFCSYDTASEGVHAQDMITSSTPGGGNGYSEDDLQQERGMEEVTLEERVHAEESAVYLPEETGRVEEHSNFSSMQQLQLRAQILVYGDLIKGVLPEESLMSSAFSDADEVSGQDSDRNNGGWNWERTWQIAAEKEAERQEAERLVEVESINVKGDVIMTEGNAVNAGADNLEPGTPSTSPIRVAEETLREVVLPAAMSQATGAAVDLSVADLDAQPTDVNGIPGTLTVNLDAVVDNIVATTVSSIESSHVKDSTMESQPTRSPSLDPWLKPHASLGPPMPGSMPSTNSPSLTTSAWQTPAQTAATASIPLINTQHGVAGGVAADSPSIVAGTAEGPEGSRKRKGRAREKKTPVPKGGESTPRRSRGKNANVGQGLSAPNLRSPAAPSRLIYESSEAAVILKEGSTVSPAGKKKEVQGRPDLHAETQSWLEQAKVSFEEAVSAANSAAEQVYVKSLRAIPNQLSSAADAVQAAASVAKAAAEAAKVAYEAAVQASLLVSDGIGVGNGQGDKDGGLGGRRSAIAAAKEEARKRATATTSSTKPTTPQSTDAVLRAARLMAEAASQAGAVLAKGNSVVPLTLPQSPVLQIEAKRTTPRGRPRKEQTTPKNPATIKVTENELPNNTKDLKGSMGSMKKGARRKGKDVVDLVASKTTSGQKGDDGQAKSPPEKATRRHLDQLMASPSNVADAPEILEQDQIVEGSLIEVMNDEEGLRGGWFSARVLQMKGGDAFVQYDEILTDDGSTPLKEWFPLAGKMVGTEPGRPQIRMVSPNNITKEEGRRKRRRTATGQRTWMVGDQVDAFVQDGWWEGVVKVVDADDETKITVHFPGEGDTSVVKSWNLRPSFVWKGERWEQWTGDGQHHIQLDESYPAKKQKKVVESPKKQARKSGRKSEPLGKVPDDATESPRASRRHKSMGNNSVPLAITTRSSPRQKITPKKKEGPVNLPSPETEVSTPTQAPTSVTTARTRSFADDAVNPVKEPRKRSVPSTGLASRTKSPLSPDVEKGEIQLKEKVVSPTKDSESMPSPEVRMPTTRQKDRVLAVPVTRRSGRL